MPGRAAEAHRNLIGEELAGFLQPALQRDGVGARGDELEALGHQRLGQDGGRRRAVARLLVRLGSHLDQQLGAYVRLVVRKDNVASDGDAIVDDLGHAVLTLQHDVAALGPQRHLHGISH